MRYDSSVYVACALLVLGGASVAESAGAQGSNCTRVAASAQAAVAPVPDIRALSGCDVAGAPALTALWARVSTLPDAQQAALRYASMDLRDARVHDAVAHVVADVALPSRTRLGALQVLTSYFDETRMVSMRALANPVGADVAIVFDFTPHRGSAPLPAMLPRAYLTQLAHLAWEDPDSQVKRAALFLRQTFSFRHAADTPLAPGAISLVAGCGSRVTVQSTADVTVPIDLHVGNAATIHSYALAPASTAQPVRVMVSLPPGPIVASVTGRTVATLPVRNAPCHPGENP